MIVAENLLRRFSTKFALLVPLERQAILVLKKRAQTMSSNANLDRPRSTMDGTSRSLSRARNLKKMAAQATFLKYNIFNSFTEMHVYNYVNSLYQTHAYIFIHKWHCRECHNTWWMINLLSTHLESWHELWPYPITPFVLIIRYIDCLPLTAIVDLWI